ncbi:MULTISPECIES: dipeptide ABC transporter ATP-binding protein [Mesorhizobium]|uniref:dipeptide ABC transporter ATP-binding protein n=1 Tax=Mesorhizobium TaxID=68287 RepID=UPI0010A96100|nr:MULTISPECIES: ABC transporter ATP-binding protein [Mesorhizobium]
MPIFSVADLRVAFGAVDVVHGVSFAVEPGRTLAIVGESGSGKSVSLLGATGLLPPQASVRGSVLHKGDEILGLSAGDLRRRRGADIGFIFQDPLSNLHPLKTIGQQIAEAITAHRKVGRGELRERVLDLLADVGIPDPLARVNDYPRQFSGGMRQRVMIAAAIALNPGLIIADEPTTALDVTVQASILDLLKRIQQDHGTAMIFVSHDLAVVSDIADDVLVMRAGHVVEQAPAELIYRAPRQAYTRELLGAARLGGLVARAARPSLLPALPSMPDLLSVSAIARSFAGRSAAGGLIRPVLQNISFTVRENEIVGLVGESGSGKSTIGRLIAGLDRPDEGSISLRERIYSRPGRGGVAIDRQLRSDIQVIFQDPYASLNPRRRIRSILAEPFIIGTKLDAAAIRRRVEDLVRDVELPEDVLDRFPAQLSGGQRQRVAIARAIALEPSLIVADEPVSALDITTQAKIIKLLRTIRRQRGLSLLFISHDLGVVSELCDRVIVLEKGVIVEAGETARVFGAPRHPYTIKLIDAIPGKALQRNPVPERIAAHA